MTRRPFQPSYSISFRYGFRAFFGTAGFRDDAMTAAAWRNRILGTGEEAPDQLVANPSNWRTHPGPQREALRGSLATVGWVQQVMVNRRTGFVVDGHARVEEALTRHEPTVPDKGRQALAIATSWLRGKLSSIDATR